MIAGTRASQTGSCRGLSGLAQDGNADTAIGRHLATIEWKPRHGSCQRDARTAISNPHTEISVKYYQNISEKQAEIHRILSGLDSQRVAK